MARPLHPSPGTFRRFFIHQQKVWQPLHAALSVDARQRALRLGQQLMASQHTVLMVDPRSPRPHRTNLDPQRIAKPAGSQILAGDLIHDEQHSIPFQLRIVVTEREQLLDSRLLKVHEVIRMVDKSLPIGLIIPNANFRFMIGKNGTPLVKWQAVSTPSYRFSQSIANHAIHKQNTTQRPKAWPAINASATSAPLRETNGLIAELATIAMNN